MPREVAPQQTLATSAMTQNQSLAECGWPLELSAGKRSGTEIVELSSTGISRFGRSIRLRFHIDN